MVVAVFVSLEGFSGSLLCFMFFFRGKEEIYESENNPFSFLGTETARTTALTFVIM